MAKQEKKLRKIVDAVRGIMDSEMKVKKLKKAKALRRFIEKLEDKRIELKRQLEAGKLSKSEGEELEKHLRTLDKQIQKAERILKEMDES